MPIEVLTISPYYTIVHTVTDSNTTSAGLAIHLHPGFHGIEFRNIP